MDHPAGLLKAPRAPTWEQPVSHHSLHNTGSVPGKNLLSSSPRSSPSTSTCHSTPVSLISHTPCADKPPWVQETGWHFHQRICLEERQQQSTFFSPAHQVIRMQVMQGLFFKSFLSHVWGEGELWKFLLRSLCMCEKPCEWQGIKIMGARLCSSTTHRISLLK